MVVVVPDPAFVERRASRRLDAANQTNGDQRIEHVVPGLRGETPDALPDGYGDFVSGQMTALAQDLERRYPRSGDTKLVPAQEFVSRCHNIRIIPRMESIKS